MERRIKEQANRGYGYLNCNKWYVFKSYSRQKQCNSESIGKVNHVMGAQTLKVE